MAHDPNFKFCSFCKGDSTRNDNLRFTHWLFDKSTGKTTCPFLLRTVCHVCLERGHTARNCKNQFKIEALRMAAMTMGGERDYMRARFAANELDDEVMRRRFMQAYLVEEKHCNFCANGKYKDTFYKTHNLFECPRLACMTCNVCGRMGHTQSKCPEQNFLNTENSDKDVPILDAAILERSMQGPFVFDFDEEDALMCDAASASG